MTTKPDKVPPELYGTWKQISGTVIEVGSGVERDNLSSAPNGFANFSSDGRVMVMSFDSARQKPAGPVPTTAEAEALFRGTIAYAGAFTIEGSRVFYDIDASWNVAWTGTRQERFWELRGNRLHVSTPEIVNPLTGKLSIHRLIFEKVAARPFARRRRVPASGA
jgi:hypothetical protein